MIALLRVDNRLIHGQVVEVWLPTLHVDRILVVDDTAAASPLSRTAMGLAVPSSVKVEVASVAAADLSSALAARERSLVLVSDVAGAMLLRARGLAFSALNLGNVHFAPGRVQVSPSVFLSPSEVESLRALSSEGVTIDLRAMPTDKSLTLADIEARVAAASGAARIGHAAHLSVK